MSDPPRASADLGPAEYSRAVLNILEDFAAEKGRLESTQRAVLNVLEDANQEKQRLQDMQRAVLNILDDLATEKSSLEEAQRDLVRSEREIRLSLKEKEVLLKEIHHRVKNNLQVISSLLNIQARYFPDLGAREIFSQTRDRVLSIALIHENLYQSARLSEVNFAQYASALVDNLFHTHDAAGRGIGRTIEIGGVQLPIDLAIPCGLIVNELVTNALKHAFPPGRAGSLRVLLWERSGRLELIVEDDGIGLPKDLDPRQTKSLGLDLVFTFAEQLEATVDVTADGGTCFRFVFSRGVN